MSSIYPSSPTTLPAYANPTIKPALMEPPNFPPMGGDTVELNQTEEPSKHINKPEKAKPNWLVPVGLAVGALVAGGITVWALREHPTVKPLLEKTTGRAKKVDVEKSPPVKVGNKTDNDLAIKKLGGGRIQVTSTTTRGTEVFELPEYLYHITAADNMPSILQSGSLNKTLRDQLKGVYLLDSQNFIKYYQTVEGLNGKSHDLITGIFKQATKNRAKGNTLASQKVSIIKIPTEQLLENGKLRIRTQEAFFRIKNKLALLQTNATTKIDVRDMHDKSNRLILRQNLVDSGMLEADIEKLLKEIEAQLHQGFTLPDAFEQKLEETNAIEYIYNQDIEFAKIKGITHSEVTMSDIITVQGSDEVVDTTKLSTLFAKV